MNLIVSSAMGFFEFYLHILENHYAYKQRPRKKKRHRAFRKQLCYLCRNLVSIVRLEARLSS